MKCPDQAKQVAKLFLISWILLTISSCIYIPDHKLTASFQLVDGYSASGKISENNIISIVFTPTEKLKSTKNQISNLKVVLRYEKSENSSKWDKKKSLPYDWKNNGQISVEFEKPKHRFYVEIIGEITNPEDYNLGNRALNIVTSFTKFIYNKDNITIEYY